MHWHDKSVVFTRTRPPLSANLGNNRTRILFPSGPSDKQANMPDAHRVCTIDITMLKAGLVANKIHVGDVLKDKWIPIKERKTPYIISAGARTKPMYKVYPVR
jgi:hypothetical protein